jgi:hypothetical protein
MNQPPASQHPTHFRTHPLPTELSSGANTKHQEFGGGAGGRSRASLGPDFIDKNKGDALGPHNDCDGHGASAGLFCWFACSLVGWFGFTCPGFSTPINASRSHNAIHNQAPTLRPPPSAAPSASPLARRSWRSGFWTARGLEPSATWWRVSNAARCLFDWLFGCCTCSVDLLRPELPSAHDAPLAHRPKQLARTLSS